MSKHEKILRKNFLCLRNRRFQRKAILEIQFHWIFILIVGAVILLFFATLIYKQKATSEKGISADVLVNLESIISGSMISAKTLNLLDVPRGTEIKYKDCNAYSTGAFSKPTKTIAMFAPETIAGRKLITWALDWNMPYGVTNYLYLTSNEVRYILVDSNINLFDPSDLNPPYYDLINEIDIEIMPDELTRDVVYYDDPFTFRYLDDSNPIKSKGNYKVRFVFYNNNPDPESVTIPTNAFGNLASPDLTAVNIIPIPDTNNRIGHVEFYKYDKNNNKFTLYNPSIFYLPYLKKEAIIGAIFAENPETYECAMQKAFRRLHYVTKVYSDRTDDLYYYYYNLPPSLPRLRECSLHYRLDALNQILSSSESFEEQNVIDIFNCAYVSCVGSTSLEQQNRALQLRSCPQIY